MIPLQSLYHHEENVKVGGPDKGNERIWMKGTIKNVKDAALASASMEFRFLFEGHVVRVFMVLVDSLLECVRRAMHQRRMERRL